MVPVTALRAVVAFGARALPHIAKVGPQITKVMQTLKNLPGVPAFTNFVSKAYKLVDGGPGATFLGQAARGYALDKVGNVAVNAVGLNDTAVGDALKLGTSFVAYGPATSTAFRATGRGLTAVGGTLKKAWTARAAAQGAEGSALVLRAKDLGQTARTVWVTPAPA